MELNLKIKMEHSDLWNALLQLSGGNTAHANHALTTIFKDGSEIVIDFSKVANAQAKHYHSTGFAAILTTLFYEMEDAAEREKKEQEAKSKIVTLSDDEVARIEREINGKKF